MHCLLSVIAYLSGEPTNNISASNKMINADILIAGKAAVLDDTEMFSYWPAA
ncbi:hypothetical protein NMYAN_10103 [Nitrosomonas nitrosa]|uniref:Uncharacterized protein n=1 Tax=Nitrosomonas nitrosa TaxID=52442 RepID=A0A8H8YY21_9PROT|nr:hypothetical protein NMYAN_10103 [Nitrosomonas nitrosa]